MLDNVSRNTHRLARIVNELLDISKIEENKLVLRKDLISLEEVIKEIADEQKPSLDKRGHTLSLEIEPDMPPVFGDHDRVAQIIINLLGNAIKYTPDGGHIRIVARGEENMAHLRVIDNGIGIKTEDIGKLFKRFATVGDVTKHKSGKDEFLAGGTGLGLSIIKGIVEAHQGQVWVESEYGVGTTFHVTLPLSRRQNGSGPQAADAVIYRATHFERPDQESAAITTTQARLKILVIDDEEDILDVTSRVLADTYTVVTAKTSATGLKEAMTQNPDIILLDVWMPGISGYDVCKTLKRNVKTKDTPVIIFTAAAEKVNEERAKEVGADGFVTKPFRKDDIVGLIESFREPAV
jgi:CheY-like chemotaxis protein